MENEQALTFLESHPLIAEDSAQDVIDDFREVLKYFTENPDPNCIPLFFRAFNDHMGWGLFQLCDDVFTKYAQTELDEHIIAALKSSNKGTRWWGAHWAMEFSSPELVDDLEVLLNNKEDEDAHYFVISALGFIYEDTMSDRVIEIIKCRKNIECDQERMELIREILHEA